MTGAEKLGSGRLLAPPPRAPVEPLVSPPTFSVVIAAYQAAETVGDAVRSALEQVWPAHQVIVVDDGSSDDVEGALRPFEGEVELIRKRNGGVASARNAGVEVATGEFVALLDADDRFHPRRLEALSALASLPCLASCRHRARRLRPAPAGDDRDDGLDDALAARGQAAAGRDVRP